MVQLAQAARKLASQGCPVLEAVTAGPPRRTPLAFNGWMYCIQMPAAATGSMLASLTKSGSLKVWADIGSISDEGNNKETHEDCSGTLGLDFISKVRSAHTAPLHRDVRNVRRCEIVRGDTGPVVQPRDDTVCLVCVNDISWNRPSISQSALWVFFAVARWNKGHSAIHRWRCTRGGALRGR